MSEPKHRHMSDLVDDLLRGILPLLMDGTPYVVFGHSMVSARVKGQQISLVIIPNISPTG